MIVFVHFSAKLVLDKNTFVDSHNFPLVETLKASTKRELNLIIVRAKFGFIWLSNFPQN